MVHIKEEENIDNKRRNKSNSTQCSLENSIEKTHTQKRMRAYTSQKLKKLIISTDIIQNYQKRT